MPRKIKKKIKLLAKKKYGYEIQMIKNSAKKFEEGWAMYIQPKNPNRYRGLLY